MSNYKTIEADEGKYTPRKSGAGNVEGSKPAKK